MGATLIRVLPKERMKKFVLSVLLLLSTCSFGASDAVKKAYNATLEIAQRTITDPDGSTCAGVAIGPHAILTATHCELPTDDLYIDSKDGPAHILQRLRDGYDHTIYLVDDSISFDVLAEVDQNNAQIADHVFTWGHPGPLTYAYREGYVSSYDLATPTTPMTVYYDINIFSGDSGAGLFSMETGKLVAVISEFWQYENDKDKLMHIHMCVVYPMAFTDDQLALAKTFTPPKKKDSDEHKPTTTTPDTHK